MKAIIKQRVREARARRARAMGEARREFYREMEEIKRLARELGVRMSQRDLHLQQGKPENVDLADLTVVSAAEAVLREKGPLSIKEIVVEIHSRGYRIGDDPWAVGHALRNGMRYQTGPRSKQLGRKWGVSANC